ncbi:hypothetical protein [Mycobacteroides abscessus]|uniref:hypothetical protein n=1 Tax=Mycobacteroides abscessus TaxID=36809 RepID=UPI001925B283|nr:hypothetical protein [Mycobacteroides abscessus]MBL3753011.1 hypothetical protein [Mycobacteroides abscessus subsp. massiliense]
MATKPKIVGGFIAGALLLSGCQHATEQQWGNPNSPWHSEHIDRQTLPAPWPFTVDSGTLACNVQEGESYTFRPDGNEPMYALNGPALDRMATMGWQDVHEIWLMGGMPRVSLDSVFDEAEKLCQGKGTWEH